MDVIKIALTGKMRSGKSAISRLLFKKYGFYYPLSFGNELKALAHTIFPWIPEEPKPRELYQFMNTMREYDEDVWIKHLAEDYEFVLTKEPTGIVIDDVRQQNEYEWARDNGFIIVRVESSDDLRKQRIIAEGDSYNEESFNHKTETYVDQLRADYTIVNNGSLDELESKVDELMAEIKKERDE